MNRLLCIVGALIICVLVGILILKNKKPEEISDNITISRTESAIVDANIPDVSQMSLSFVFTPSLTENNKRTMMWVLPFSLPNKDGQYAFKGYITFTGKLKVLIVKNKTPVYGCESSNLIDFSAKNKFSLHTLNSEHGMILKLNLNDIETVGDRIPIPHSSPSGLNLIFKHFSGSFEEVVINNVKKGIKRI